MIPIFFSHSVSASLYHLKILIHYGFGALALFFVMVMIQKKLSHLDYDAPGLRRFMITSFFVTLGSMVVLHYGVSFLFSHLLSENKYNYCSFMVTHWKQVGLLYLLPILLMIAILAMIASYDVPTVLDTVALHIPLVMAGIQCAFIITGYGWGRSMHLNFAGYRLIPGPVPLYALIMNLAIYFYLLRLYTRITQNVTNRRRYSGVIWPLFLLLFGSGTLFLEHYGKDSLFYLKLTMTQMMMIVLILTGLLGLIRFFMRRPPSEKGSSDVDSKDISRLLYVGGFVIMTFIFIFVVYYLIRRVHVIGWPFVKTSSLSEAYGRILQYLPIIGLPAIAFLWMKQSNMALRDAFAMKRISLWFYPALIASTGYGLYKLFGKSTLKGMEYLPPVIILSALNAFFEEFTYRFVFFRLLRQSEYSRLVSHTAQAVFYAIPHFMLAGFLFGTMSFLYGLIMGLLSEDSQSITPALICHFIIDIGCIGSPLMRV